MDDDDYIDSYFKKTLSPDELKRFDEKIKEDPVFAGEVAFYSSSMQEIKDQLTEEKKNRFREIYERSSTVSNPGSFRKLWPYIAAAAMITAIVLGFYLFNNTGSPERMADKYLLEKWQTMPVTMGIKEDSLQKGKDLYNEMKFTEALNQFETILITDTANTEAKKFAGIVSLRLQQYDKALKYFEQLENCPNLFSNPGKLYHALTLMKRNLPGDKQSARQLLQQVVDSNLEGKEDAEKWLRKL